MIIFLSPLPPPPLFLTDQEQKKNENLKGGFEEIYGQMIWQAMKLIDYKYNTTRSDRNLSRMESPDGLEPTAFLPRKVTQRVSFWKEIFFRYANYWFLRQVCQFRMNGPFMRCRFIRNNFFHSVFNDGKNWKVIIYNRKSIR